MDNQPNTILAGDVGGTKTILALYPLGGEPVEPVRKQSYPSQAFSSLEEILQNFLEETSARITFACFDVAGPVVGGMSRITNLPWLIDSASLSRLLQAPVELVNDMDAIAYTVAHAESIRCAQLQVGEPQEKGRRAVLAPGTGLGEGFLVWSQDQYLPFGSEGGHTDFAPRGELQIGLLEYLSGKFQHISYERVCSGLGIQNLYAFLKDSGRYPEPDWLRQELETAADPTPLIIQTAMADKAPICRGVLDLFTDILGSEAGNLALKILSTGGVYLAGGIPRRILPWLQRPSFLHAFTHKGRFREILNRIPLYVVLEPEAALMGAAWMGFDRFRLKG